MGVPQRINTSSTPAAPHPVVNASSDATDASVSPYARTDLTARGRFIARSAGGGADPAKAGPLQLLSEPRENPTRGISGTHFRTATTVRSSDGGQSAA